ncbi:MAG: cobaltochelatase CobT [Alphaproteobacteria bacterium]|jgi:cobaltochelatase CobT
MSGLESAKQSIIETTRALAGQANLIVRFAESIHISAHEITLPLLESDNPLAVQLAKGQADRLAFIYRYGEAAHIFTHFSNAGDTALRIIAMIETARTESLGLQEFPGSEGHISPLLRKEESFFADGGTSLFHQTYVASLVLKKRLLGSLQPQSAALLNRLDYILPIQLKQWAETADLSDESQRQTAYKQLIDLLKIEDADHQNEMTNAGETAELNDKADASDEQPIMGKSETIKEMDGTDSKASDGEEDSTGSALLETEGMATPFFYAGQETTHGYKIFTKAYDAELDISNLVDDSEKKLLKHKFAVLADAQKGLARQLCRKLRHKLLSKLDIGWRFDTDEGVLDASKLASFIAGGHESIFRLPRKKQVMDTTVTILVDNSGSMRGRPIEMAAITTDILTKTLEQTGVTTEVLGFTTKAWKGGESRLDWISAGRPKNPGRLNELLHIIYKQGRIPYRKQKDNFAYMLADDLLKENVDGESLMWAYKRLMKRTQGRKILMVISDGAPVDYATDRHNKAGYLDSHLKSVITQIERNKTVELIAVGIGHEVERYYKNAVMIENAETLGETLLEELSKLFE